MKNDFLKVLRQIKEIHLQLSIRHLILPAHIILTLLYIYHHESAGKYSISDFLYTNDARGRKILNLLELNGLIIKNKGRKGSELTEKGNNLCEDLRNYFKIFSLFESVDLGPTVLGTINGITAIPLAYITQPINVIELRDTSLRYGALGASIFKVIIGSNGDMKVYFIDDTTQTNKIVFPDQEKIIRFISTEKKEEKIWIIIASTIGTLPSYYFNPIFDNNNAKREDSINPFTVALVASVQTLWELIEKELGEDKL